MKLLEYQGKKVLKKYGIEIPRGKVVLKNTKDIPFKGSFVLKSQVPTGDRKKRGGILFGKTSADFQKQTKELFEKEIGGWTPTKLLFEEQIKSVNELYVSFSYDTRTRKPVLSISQVGGTGIAKAKIFPIDLEIGFQDFFLRDVLFQSGIKPNSELNKVIKYLWRVFEREGALLAEINPLFELKDGTYIAGDAKIILDDNVVDPNFRPYLELPGDIAILASGGGASMINLDAIMHYGGKPANYVEYSGNPSALVVEELTVKVLSKKGLKGCWTVGGTANFTDIYETLLGFVQGLRRVSPKPTYPIVIRRDGPRQKEAFEMLAKVAKEEGYDFYLFGPETPMSKSAEILVKLMKKK